MRKGVEGRYSSRKFLLALLAHLSATAVLYLRLIDGTQWVTATGAALMFYTAGNVAQKFMGGGDAS